MLLFADEAFYANDKKHESRLKTMITESTMAYEYKGKDVIQGQNCISLIMASNDEHVVPAGELERRFLVLDVGDRRQKDNAYFARIAQQMEQGGREALLHMLLTYDLTDFNVFQVPRTRALTEQMELSLSPEKQWWLHKLENGQLFEGDVTWPKRVRTLALFKNYARFVQDARVTHPLSERVFGRFVHKMCPDVKRRQYSVDGEIDGDEGFAYKSKRRVWHYDMPSLEDCRGAWDRMHGSRDWPEIQEPPAGQQGGKIPF